MLSPAIIRDSLVAHPIETHKSNISLCRLRVLFRLLHLSFRAPRLFFGRCSKVLAFCVVSVLEAHVVRLKATAALLVALLLARALGRMRVLSPAFRLAAGVEEACIEGLHS